MEGQKFGPGFLDGWLFGNVDASGHFTGNDIAYIYADLTTVIYGTFANSTLIEGRERKVKGFRSVLGVVNRGGTTLNGTCGCTYFAKYGHLLCR